MLSLRIALRYLLAKKSHTAVNVISWISIAGVAVATMAIMVVLSVFNGFTDLATSHLALIDPDLKAVRADGRVILEADSVADALRRLPAVAAASPTLSERGLALSAGGEQMPVVFKGVDRSGYAKVVPDLEEAVVDGEFMTVDAADSTAALTATLAVGPAVGLALRPTPYEALELYVPRRTGRINPANPGAAYRGEKFAVDAVFSVNQPEYDTDFMLIPLSSARNLLEYTEHEASAIEICLRPGADADDAAKAVAAALGGDFEVLNRYEQQPEAFRMISIEKWVTFLMLIFILLIASFNIISTVSLLIIEKRDNMATLRALGASKSAVGRIFALEGWLITLFGGIIGTLLGLALSLAQQHFGFVKLGADPTTLTIDAYPVRVEATDALMVVLAVALVGGMISCISRFMATSGGSQTDDR